MFDSGYEQYVELDEPTKPSIINYTSDIESNIQINPHPITENRNATSPAILLSIISNIFGMLLPFQS